MAKAKSLKDRYLARLVRYIPDKKVRDAIIEASKERDATPKKSKKTEEDSDLDSNEDE